MHSCILLPDQQSWILLWLSPSFDDLRELAKGLKEQRTTRNCSNNSRTEVKVRLFGRTTQLRTAWFSILVKHLLEPAKVVPNEIWTPLQHDAPVLMKKCQLEQTMHAFVNLRVRHCVGDNVCFFLAQPIVGIPWVSIPDFILVAGGKVNVVIQKYIVLIRFGIFLILGVNPQNTRKSWVYYFRFLILLNRKLGLIWVCGSKRMIIDDQEY